jgi:hypothetical protein
MLLMALPGMVGESAKRQDGVSRFIDFVACRVSTRTGTAVPLHAVKGVLGWSYWMVQ